MFEYITIKGFQPFQEITLEFDELITTLTGPSDSGKSAIIRALRWLVLNKAPKRHINFQSTSASVKLKVDGHTIIRKQSDKQNLYILDGKKFKSFNKGVPEEIAKILNIEEINFQRQLDAHFWISLSASQVSKEINKLVDLEVIDRASAAINSKLRKAKLEVEITEDRIKQAREECKSLDWVREADEKLREIEHIDTNLIGMRACYVGLSSYTANVSELKSNIGDYTQRIVASSAVVNAFDKLENSRKTLEELRLLDDNILDCVQHANIEVPDTAKLDQLLELKRLTKLIDSTKEELCEIKKEIQSGESHLNGLLKGMKECPICGSSLTKMK